MQPLPEVLAAHPNSRLWLVAPTISTGSAWLQHLKSLDISCENVVATTAQHLAAEIAANQLKSSGCQPISDSLGGLIVRAIWETRPTELNFQNQTPTARFCQAVAATVQELRLNGISSAKLLSGGGSEESKSNASDLAVLLDAWDHFLSEHKFADAASVLAIARDVVASGKLSSEDVVLLPEFSEFAWLESQFMAALPRQQIINCESPLVYGPDDDDGFGLDLFRSIGEANEVHEVIRRCVEEEIPLGDVELLHTDSETYLPLLLRTSQLLDVDHPTPPITFADGFPAALCRPIESLLAWLDWEQTDCSCTRLAEMFESGLLKTGQYEGPELAATLRSINANSKDEATGEISDADNLSDLRLLIARLQAKPLQSPGQTFDANQIDFLATTISHLDEPPTSLAAAESFLSDHAPSSNEYDQAARLEILNRIAQWKSLLQHCELQIDAREWLTCLCQQTMVNKSGPKPDCLHVASLATGAQSGRTRTYIAGLHADRFPGEPMQDHIMPDAQRIQLSEDFPTATARQESELSGFQQSLSQLRGELTVSWVCLDADTGKWMQASSLVHKLGQMMVDCDPADWSEESLNELAGDAVEFSDLQR